MYLAGPKANPQIDLHPSSNEESHRRQELGITKHELWTYQDDEAPRGYHTAAWERGGVIGHEPSNAK